MDDYYKSNALPPQEVQRQMSQQNERLQQQQQQQQQPCGNVIDMINPSSVSGTHMPLQHPTSAMPQLMSNRPMVSGDSLDDIIRNNHTEMHRRKSMSHAYGSPLMQDDNPRRLSSIGASEDVMDFGASHGDLGNFQFSQQVDSSFSGINTSLDMTDQMGGFVTDAADYTGISPDLMNSMNPPPFGNVEMSQMPNESSLSLFPPSTVPGTGSGTRSMSSAFNSGQMPNLSTAFATEPAPSSSSLTATSSNLTGSVDEHPDGVMHISTSHLNVVDPAVNRVPEGIPTNPVSNGMEQSLPHSLSRHKSSESAISTQHGAASASVTQPTSTSGPTTPATTSTPRENKEKTIYSKSGFDMLKALWLVATRKDPKIHLGAVDMSCAFVVCDVTMNDCPIVYVSDNFQNLTGYSRHEIVGQNCRFLQAPDGKVEAGSKREFVDDGAVFNLKKMIQEGREVQQSLINYRKGGKPFLNLLTMIPIPWDTEDIRYFIGFQIDLVECPDAISGQELGGVRVNYKHNDIGQYIWTPPASSQWEPENGQTLGVDDVSTLLQQFSPKGLVSDWHKQSWDKMLLENTDDVVHVLSLKGLFLYLSPSSKRVLEYDAIDLVGNSLSSICHPSDIVPVTRELKDATAGTQVNIVFRIRRKQSGYTWFESHGSLFVEQGKGRKCLILVGRKRPVFALSRKNLEANGGIGDSEIWTKLSTSGMFLFVSSNVRSLLDLQPESLVGTSIQDLMRKESRPEFGRSMELARRGKTVTCKHEVQNRRGQGLQAQTTLYPGDAPEGLKPSFLLAQTKLLKASSRSIVPANATGNSKTASTSSHSNVVAELNSGTGQVSQPAGGALPPGTQDAALAAEDNIFGELRTTKCSSWQFELRQMEKVNRILAEELGGLLSNKKKRKRRKGVGNLVRDCANCHTRNTPEWRRGPSGQRDLCNSCGLRWAKQTGRVSPRNSSRGGNNGNGDTQSKKSASPIHSSPLHKELSSENPSSQTVGFRGDSDGSDRLSSMQLLGHTTNEAPEISSAQRQTMAMPPPSQPSLSSGVAGSGMTSIREEREASQS
ncbi:white collar 1 [Metarhizium album ARSEF 1941]|uniref:White collar 1 n=1 Tax=Metarhizium album (strain ARSEF 1941) TaxID=1081103 RepID=A0A0B2WXX2_METAS|nr:white collar 1 [Metarhizium album ARSEF 1941]KHO01137.1 white collar 1 [Metarhizium album ARSEF 1941]